jgi:hypothetical protein
MEMSPRKTAMQMLGVRENPVGGVLAGGKPSFAKVAKQVAAMQRGVSGFQYPTDEEPLYAPNPVAAAKGMITGSAAPQTKTTAGGVNTSVIPTGAVLAAVKAAELGGKERPVGFENPMYNSSGTQVYKELTNPDDQPLYESAADVGFLRVPLSKNPIYEGGKPNTPLPTPKAPLFPRTGSKGLNLKQITSSLKTKYGNSLSSATKNSNREKLFANITTNMSTGKINPSMQNKVMKQLFGKRIIKFIGPKFLSADNKEILARAKETQIRASPVFNGEVEGEEGIYTEVL